MAYLKEWAKLGKGNFHEASSVGDLVTAFTDIVASAIVDSTSYAAPSVSINAFNRISHNNEIYFAIFKPGQTPLWDGNIKKFKIANGNIVDKNGNPAVDEITRGIKETATSVWSDEPDGMVVTKGGAGGVLSNMISSRKIFTYTGSENVNDVNNKPNRNIELDTADNLIQWSNQKLTKQLLLGLSGTVTDNQVNSEMSDDERDALINWIRGNDRWAFGDPLHSSPVEITFGTEKNPIKKLFVGTNDGLIRMIDANTGKEDWAFLPPDLLPIQQKLKKNEATGERIYGIDGTATSIIRDRKDGSIGRVIVYFSMRSGGRNIYALDVTTPNKPKLMWVIKGGVGVDKDGKPRDSKSLCPDGSSDCSPGYERLGLTWSLPKPIELPKGFANCAKPALGCSALVFGGGYNNGAEYNDSSTYLKSGCTSNIGNAIYIADAATGKRIWWASNAGSGADVIVNGMNCEIPSNIGIYDDNADDSPDSFYVGDLGGNVWRLDLNNGTGTGAVKKSLGAKLAALSDGTVQGKRQFFYPPEVIRVQDTIYSSEEDYRLVTITSGTRSNPLNQTIRNQFYALRDRAVNGLLDNNNDGAADMDTRGATPVSKFYTLSLVDLQDITDDVLQTELNAKTKAQQEGTTYSGNYEAKVKEIQGKKGWYLSLQDVTTKAWKGEKGSSSPIILDGKVFFTTYTPVAEISIPQGDSCTTTFSDGTSRLYALDIFMGGAAYDFSEVKPGEGANPLDVKSSVFGEANDRTKNLRSGMVGDILPVFDENGNIHFLSNDPLQYYEVILKNPLAPTFWMQEQ
jgi:type IV pilus assembly protein PilY1